jgi:membrane protease YdiL (CAAX protease family)
MHTSAPSNKSASIRRLIARHPYISILVPVIIFLFADYPIGLILRLVHTPFLPAHLVSESFLVGVVAILIALPRWWSETGFTHSLDRRTPLICLGAIILLGLRLLLSLPPLIAAKVPLSLAVLAVVISLMVGFVEEGVFRGLIIRILLPKGILLAALLSSVIFAALHLLNLLSGLPLAYVVGQMIIAFGLGLLFSAIRLRTGSIWPTLLLHGIFDSTALLLLALKPTQATATPLNFSIIVASILCLPCLINAAILLRPSKLRQLHRQYGLMLQIPANEGSTSHPLPY